MCPGLTHVGLRRGNPVPCAGRGPQGDIESARPQSRDRDREACQQGRPWERRLPAGSPEQLRSSLLRSREEASPSASCPAHRAGCCRRHALPLALSPFPRAMLFVSEASSVIHVGRSTVIFTRTPKYSQPSRTGKSGLRGTQARSRLRDLESLGLSPDAPRRSRVTHRRRFFLAVYLFLSPHLLKYIFLCGPQGFCFTFFCLFVLILGNHAGTLSEYLSTV